MMIVAHKPGQSEHKEKAIIQEIITLTADAKEKYEKYYFSLQNPFLKRMDML